MKTLEELRAELRHERVVFNSLLKLINQLIEDGNYMAAAKRLEELSHVNCAVGVLENQCKGLQY